MRKLVVTQGSDTGQQFDLTTSVVTIGRHSGNTVALHDEKVSRRHLELRATPNGYQLFDLQSGNGTLVNGRLVQVIDLRNGDQITIGDTTLVYSAESQLSQPTPSAEQTRLVVRPGDDAPSGVVRTIPAEMGSQLLVRPDLASTEWLRQRLATLTVLYEATNAVSDILDVEELLGRIMDLVLRTTDADHGCVMLADYESGDLMPKAIRSRVPGGEFVISRTIVDHVLKECQGVLVDNAATDERFRGGESIARHQIREVICVPMKGRRGSVGVIFLDTAAENVVSSPRVGQTKFTPDHLTLAVAVAHQAALAVEETRYYQALLQAERLAAVGQTIAALSHHIKNIMQGIRFGGDMVRMGFADDDRELLTKGWRLVEKNQSRIDDLILDMLSYSKEREPAIEPTNLNTLVEEVLEVLRGRIAELGVTIGWVPEEGLPSVPCDPDGVHRALLNIVSNALDAVDGQTDPRITITTNIADASVVITVGDNGPGIAQEKLADMFKPFVSTKGARGTGLGLPAARKTLREHGGDVTVESATGEGACFSLRLPFPMATSSPATEGTV